MEGKQGNPQRKSVIKRLDEVSVSKICVNQVIADLTSCVKELVENSLDAGATRIEINLKEQGKEGIDVIDNGSGITKENLNKIAEKGATSKLSDFNDMTSLRTFGFRGEALNALSVLCTLSITTRVESEEIGVKYTFGQDKESSTSVPIHREKGTTVSLRNIFAKIPVRKQEFEKNISNQYTKMLNIMREYMLIAQHCSIFVVNESSKKSGRQVVLNSGPPATTMKSKIAEVYGHSLAESLSEFSFDFSDSPCRAEGYVLNKHISGSHHAQSSKTNLLKNKGLIWVNNRPTSALQKTSSIFSEIYKKYNDAAEFVYFLHLKVAPDDVDFNLSPDKREIILKPEKEFYSALHQNLSAFFERIGAVSRVLLPATSNKRSDILSDNSGGQQTIFQKQSPQSNNNSSMVIENSGSHLYSTRNINKQPQLQQQTLLSSFNQPTPMESQNYSQSPSDSSKQSTTDPKQTEQLFGSSIQRSRVFKEDQLSLASQRKLAMERLLGNAKESLGDSKQLREEQEEGDTRNQQLKQRQIFESQQNPLDDSFSKPQEKPKINQLIEGKSSPEESKHVSSEETEDDRQIEQRRNESNYIHVQQYQVIKSDQQMQDVIEESNGYKILNYPINTLKKSINKDSMENNGSRIMESECLSNTEENLEQINEDQRVNSNILRDSIHHFRAEKEQQLTPNCCDHDHSTKQPTEHLHRIRSPNAQQDIQERQIENPQVNKQGDLKQEVQKQQKNDLKNRECVDKQAQSNSIRGPVRKEDKSYLKELAEEFLISGNGRENGSEEIMFTKEEFATLKVIGQFNKAFIISFSADRNEIYLIDQHASDEKTNFEKLMRENVFSCQKLLQPISLNVTSNEVDILENNRAVFTRNGFSFAILKGENNSGQASEENTNKSDQQNDEDDDQFGESTNRNLQSNEMILRIEQLPASKHIQFDISDFDELFTKLNCETFDAQHYRPKKIQRILASKACRKSIMVGEALNENQMKQILLNLSELQSPWNCPHGRPTMVKTPPFNSLYSSIKVKHRYQL